MRTKFIHTLTELAKRDPRIMLLTGDLGFMALEPFADQFPDRFFNVGVAEQNMVGLASGLAEAGLIPFVYSIATFASMRAYEFIRNGPILHGLKVRIIAVGGGFEYGSAGITHHALEDIGIMRTQPGLTIIAPADWQQAHTALEESWDIKGPVYYRIGKDDKTIIPGLDGRFKIGEAQIIRKGNDSLLFISSGGISKEVVAAAKKLEEKNIPSSIIVVASINPAPTQGLKDALAKHRNVVTVEAHYINGGIGSLVAEIIAEHNLDCRLVRCAVRSPADGISGSQAFLENKYGLCANALVKRVEEVLKP